MAAYREKNDRTNGVCIATNCRARITDPDELQLHNHRIGFSSDPGAAFVVKKANMTGKETFLLSNLYESHRILIENIPEALATVGKVFFYS